MKEKQSYLALIFDLARVPQYDTYSPGVFSEIEVVEKENTPKQPKKKFLYFQKEYSNKRWGLYCACGHMTEFNIDLISRNSDGKILSLQPLVCQGCQKVFHSLSDVKLIYSKSPSANVTSKRFSVVEKDNFYALYSFATTMFVSVTTKKLIFRDIGKHSLYFSKKSDVIKTKVNDKLITIPFRFLVKHCCSVVNYMTQNALYENVIPQGIFERQVINPLLKFCEIIESKCDVRDVNKLLVILEKERDYTYYNFMFKNLSSYPSDYGNFFASNCSYDLKAFSDNTSEVSASRYIWLQYLKRRLCIMLAISAYPPIVTLIFTYGPDNFLLLLTNSTLMCSLTSLKKKKPTNPKDILETMFKCKITSEFSKKNKIIKYIKTEEKKRKRKLKAHPQNKDLINPITQHPLEFVDSRVPVQDDIKFKLKNLHFRKFYVDLFLQGNFDEMTKVFYSFLNNQSVFDDISTMDKIILDNRIEDAGNLIIGLQNVYDQNIIRLGDFKINYKYLCHILKMFHAENDEQKSKVRWNNELGIYADTIFMMKDMEIPLSDIFKAKTFKALEDIHNALTHSYRLTLDKKLSSDLEKHILKFRHTEGIFSNIKFHLIDTPEKFYEESSVMNHCVKTYCTNVAKGHFVIYSLEDTETGDRATLSINIQNVIISPDGDDSNVVTYTFNQLKAKNNARPTEKIINTVKDFIKDFFKIKEYGDCYDLRPLAAVVKPPIQVEDEILIYNNNNIVLGHF